MTDKLAKAGCLAVLAHLKFPQKKNKLSSKKQN